MPRRYWPAAPEKPLLPSGVTASRLLLVDLDQVGVRAWQMAGLLAAVRAVTGGVEVAVGSGAPPCLRAYKRALRDAGVSRLRARPGRDGADRTLLAAAHRYGAPGATVFVVSGDAGFRALVDLGFDLVVLSCRPESVSARLRAAARLVLALPVPQDSRNLSRTGRSPAGEPRPR